MLPGGLFVLGEFSVLGSQFSVKPNLGLADWELRTLFGTGECLHPYNTLTTACEVGGEANVLRSMWFAVAIRRATLRTLRQTGAWTHRASAQPGSRPCPAGGHSVDGVLGVARGCGSGRDHCRADDLRPRDPYSEWPASRGHGLAAASYHLP